MFINNQTCDDMAKRPKKIVHRDFFNDHLVEIVDSDGCRSLYFAGNVLQSRISLATPHQLVLFYTRYMMTALLARPRPRRVLIIGIGAGALIHFLHYYFPDCLIDAIDHSPQIITMAKTYFRIPDRASITLHCCDALDFLSNAGAGEDYDLIFIDAFDDKGMAKTIYCEEFFGLCRRSLLPDGVLSSNFWSAKTQELERVKQAFARHPASRIYLPVQGRGNLVGLAFKTPVPWDKIDRPEQELTALGNRYGFDLTEIVRIAKKNNMTIGKRLGSFFINHGNSH